MAQQLVTCKCPRCGLQWTMASDAVGVESVRCPVCQRLVHLPDEASEPDFDGEDDVDEDEEEDDEDEGEDDDLETAANPRRRGYR